MRGFSTLVTPPAEALVSTAEMKAHLRVDFSDDDMEIEAMVEAARQYLDGPAGILGRALVTQEWSWTVSAATENRMVLPVVPVQSVSSVTFFDAENAQQTMPAESYRLIQANQAAWLQLEAGMSWPAVYPRDDAMTVTYTAGYGDAMDVPRPIRLAATMMAAAWYEGRDGMAPRGADPLPSGVQALIDLYRVPRAVV